MFGLGKKKEKKEEAKAEEKDAAAGAPAPTGMQMKGDLAIKPYRRVTKDATKLKERKAFEAKLKQISAGYKSKKVPHLISFFQSSLYSVPFCRCAVGFAVARGYVRVGSMFCGFSVGEFFFLSW
jgi:hypothetical protein